MRWVKINLNKTLSSRSSRRHSKKETRNHNRKALPSQSSNLPREIRWRETELTRQIEMSGPPACSPKCFKLRVISSLRKWSENSRRDTDSQRDLQKTTCFREMKQRSLQQQKKRSLRQKTKMKILQENKAKQTIESKFFLRQDILPRIRAFLQFHVLVTSPRIFCWLLFLLLLHLAPSSSQEEA